ncbi:1-acyl-sn-glycerol-3-phosphate acyltransferase [Chitinophaga sancti]|uniref:lysophospholipid acyltransferase family protein n=1 Tax=Chitinophaga sancti TaxID=1004 RepID=UPI002A76194F|nr:1-acyl-sn-glycerol-3-phosphate acyltransferase [Chitinophaga sancti]WPQ62058.1 1-acyl-sn-glycerol-3-phosphate acyltransferase [Chitinophaga sancti]
MNWLKNLAGRIYALYVLMIFTIFMLIFLLPMWLVSFYSLRTRVRRFVKSGRLWCRIMMPMIGCPVRTKGRENFAPGQAYIIVCNHNSFMDIPATYAGIPGIHKSLAKKEMVNAPIFGIMYKIGSVLVDRKDPASRKHSFVEMKEVLRNGMHMLLYPEGTRNKTDQPLKEFYDGAFSLAIDTKKPILPTIIRGTKEIMPPGKTFFAWPHAVKMEFLPPISTIGYTLEDMEELKAKVFRIMWEHYQNP